jgi:hypothetical protein
MTEQATGKRFTRVDTLIVVVIGLAVIVLAPALWSQAQKAADRKRCAANLAPMGKAMFLYAADYGGALPRAGGPTTTWGPTHNWVAPNRNTAFGLGADGSGGRATISSSFYLLVKYYEMPTKLFVCPSDKGTTEFSLRKLVGTVPHFTFARAWDFGPSGESFKHSSYAYHMPYGPFALTTSRDPNLAVAADGNPFLRSPGGSARAVANFRPDIDPYRGTVEQGRAGNAISHDLEGQNVLFLDQHVTFEKRAFCGVGKDNIYLISELSDQGCVTGSVPIPGGTAAVNERDSVLVHDPAAFGLETAAKKP